jgi:putative two-component system response regulator
MRYGQINGDGQIREETRHPEARIFIVDDEKPNVALLEDMLASAGYWHIVSATDPTRALDIVDGFDPDLILLDLHMPKIDGFELMARLRTVAQNADVPIIVLTADATPAAKHRALSVGAQDFLSKPFDVREVLLRIQNMLDSRFLHKDLREEKEHLEHRVRERTKDLEEAQTEAFERLALAAELRDDDTGQHTRRVGATAALVAQALGQDAADVAMIQRAAALHDVGKIGIPDSILLAPRKLTPEEFEIVKTHTQLGAHILSGSRIPALVMAEEIAWSHHERWDGTGYAGVAGEAIPLVGRITTVVDVFDALTHERPYKRAWTVDEAISEIDQQRGRQFDPFVVAAFMDVQEVAASISVGSFVN